VEGFWPIFFPSVVPVTYLLYLAWCVIRHTPEVEEAPGGAEGHDPPHWRRNPRRPRGPRRGPHGPDAQPLPECPPGRRFRVLTPSAPARAAAQRHQAQSASR
jgi:hypothetical protein